MKLLKNNNNFFLQSFLLTTIFILLSDNNYFVTLSHSLEANNQKAPNFNSNNNHNINRDHLSAAAHNNINSKKDEQSLGNNGPPIVINHQQDRVVGVGSNISLECTARGKGLTFVWFQDEKNITTTNNSSSSINGSNEPISTTKLLEERRYEIAEEPSQLDLGLNVTTSILYLFNLKLTDTSLFLCWVENTSGYTIANFSLTVTNDAPPSQLNGQLMTPINNDDNGANSYLLIMNTNKTLNYASLVFVCVLIIGILLLLLSKLILSFNKQNNLEQRSNSSQSSSSNDLKPQSLHHHQSSFLSSNAGDESSSSPIGNNEYGFIEHMRSGIINMDYHSMSPVIQFNQNNSKQQLQQQHQQQHHHHQQQIQQQHLHHQQLSAASLLQHHNPPVYPDSGTIPDLYHAAAAMYNPQPGSQPTLMNHQHHLHQPQQQQQQVAFLQEMPPPRNNYQRNLDYDRFHIL